VSNIVGFEARASVERQAREWLIRLDGDEPLTRPEIQALREWMGRSPLHREELRRLVHFWKQANVITELAVSLESHDQDSELKKGSRARIILAVAITAVASIALGWWMIQQAGAAANGTYGTAIGQQQTIILPDGSSLQLNTDSQVQVRYSDSLRRIRLQRGEALFFVTHELNRPFEVYVADSVVRAVGTAFAVYVEGSKVNITVTKGVVDVAEVDHPQTSAAGKLPVNAGLRRALGRLEAGQATTFGSGAEHLDVHQLAEAELQRRMAWHEGYLIFSGEPLRQVVEQMNRYSPVTLEIGDPDLASVAIGGRFRIGDLDAVLDMLHTNFRIRSHQLDERNIRLESERPPGSPQDFIKQ
jgi:transmembrane sensor